MKKIMFNDRYGLTQAVIEGRMTMTRRMVPWVLIEQWMEIVFNAHESEQNFYERKAPRYKVGEVVAVAQSYNEVVREFTSLALVPGSTNKMFVKAELMPHQIRITGIKCERLQDISDADCLREGIRYLPKIGKFYFEDTRQEEGFYFDDHREAFASLIDKVSGKGTWDRNPWVVVYEFALVK